MLTRPKRVWFAAFFTVSVLFALQAQAQLAGNHKIGGAGGFKSFTAAVDSLKKVGISGPVVFEVTGGIYQEQFEIPAIIGASAANTITFRPATNDTVKLQFEPTAARSYVVKLTEADFIRFEKIVFDGDPKNDDNGYGRIFSLSGTIEGLQISNCVLWGRPSNLYYYAYELVFSAAGTRTNNLFIAGNTFIDGNWQLVLNGQSNNRSTGTILRDNKFINAGYLGVYLANHRDAVVTNNFVAANSFGVYGFYLESSPKTLLYHNSVNLLSANTDAAAVYVGGSNTDSVQIKNNIFSNSGNGYAAYYGNLRAVGASDYNAFNTFGGTLLRWGNNLFYPTLSAFQADPQTSPFERNSLEADPGFVLATAGDLHTNAPFLDGRGTANLRIAVTTDIDGQNRSALTPVDIGADAYQSTVASLSGSYTLGAGGNYPNFNAAIAALRTRGVSGPVVFAVKGGTYAEQFEIPAIGGASATNTITFKPQTTDTVKIALEPTQAKNYLVRLAGADYVHFEKIVFDSDPKNDDNGYGRVFWLSGSTTGVQVRNCILAGRYSVFYYYEYQLLYSPNTVSHKDLLLAGNVFIDGNDQVYLISPSNNLSTGTVVTGNKFINAGRIGLVLERQSNALVTNNFISGSTAGDFGIYLNFSPKTLLYHNSVYLPAVNTDAPALYVNGNNSDSLQIKNNIFCNTGGGYAAYIENPQALYASDYNDFHATGSTLIRWTYYTNYANLAFFQAAQSTVPYERNSLEADPGFLLTTPGDLHTKAPFLDGRGTANLRTPVLTDVDGEDRSALTPVDIGADAYRSTLTPLVGNYIIGSGGNYPNFTAAVAALKMAGVAGPVVFNVKGGTYAEQFEIPAIAGASAINTITFKPQTTDTVKIALEPTQAKNYLVRLAGADHVHFEKIVFDSDPKNDDNGYGRVFWLSGSTSGVQIRNCMLAGHFSEAYYQEYQLLFSPNTVRHADLLIAGNVFIDGNDQVYLISPSNNLSTGTVVTGNKFINAGRISLVLERQSNTLVTNNFISGSTAGDYGIYLNFSPKTQLYHNSVYLPATNAGAPALYVNGNNNDSLQIKNNIFCNTGGGYAAYVDNPKAVQVSDYNDFHATGSTLIQWTYYTPYASLAAFQADASTASHERNSLEADPGFLLTTPGDLHTQAPFLDRRGTTNLRTPVLADIDGEDRSALTPVDIGADAYRSTLTPLVGNYIIGSGGNYPNFTAAVAALKMAGVSGPVVFNVKGGVYNEQFEIPAIGGASAKNTITFKPLSADTVKLQFEPASNKNYIVQLYGADHIHFDGLFLNGDPANNHNGYGKVFYLVGAIDSLEIRNCLIKGRAINSDERYALLNSADNTRTNALVVKNNVFVGGSWQIHLRGSNGNNALGSQILSNQFLNAGNGVLYLAYHGGATIENNKISGAAYRGFWLAQCDGGPRLRRNEIEIKQGGQEGIRLEGCSGAYQVAENKVALAQYGTGIYIYGSNAAAGKEGLVANNFVAVGAANNNVTSYGIRLYYSSFTLILHNSVAVTSAATGSAALLYEGLNQKNECKNNIFACFGSGYAANFTGTGGLSRSPAGSNYNDFYTTGTTLIRWENTNYANLAAFKNASVTNPFERNSLDVNPQFILSTPNDLHTRNAFLDATGTVSLTLPVPIDIDGEIRNFLTPVDIGADAFTSATPESPNIAVSDNRLDFGEVYSGATDTLRLIMSNLGVRTLNVISLLSSSPAFALDRTPFSLNQNQSRTLAIVFKPGASALYTDTLKIVNNDPDTPVFNVALRGEGFTLPDLQVTRVQAPPTAASGQPIQINWTVANNGNDGTKSSGWYDEVLLSPTPNLDQNATRIILVENFSALNAGEGYTNIAAYTLPRGISGTYYVFVRTDRFNSERERDETNNLRSSPAMAVTLSPYPDLQVAAVTATNNAFSGDSIEVRWTVQNHGTGRTEPDNWFDTIFLSDDDSLNFAFIGRNNIRINETQLGIIKHSGALEVGQSYTATTKVWLPHTIFGTRYIFVYTDIRGGATQAEEGGVYEYNFNLNNWRSDSINIRLRPTPDLVVRPAQAPGAASLGEDIAVSWTVENQGADETFESSWQDLIYLSRSAAFRLDSAVVLGAFTRNGKLKRDSSYTASRTVRVPNGFSGVNYFFVHTDWSNNVFEYQSDGNNISPTGAPIVINNPDFAVRTVKVPGAASSGKSIEIIWSVFNNGPGAVFNMFWNDRVYLSRLPVFNPDSATVIGAFSRSAALRKDSSYTVTRPYTLPNGLSGDYYVFVETNSDRRVFENQAVSNNRGRSDNAMRVQLSPWPDLQVTTLQVPDSLNAGGRMTVTWTVGNRGVAATEAAAWTDRVYLSPGATWNPNNALLLASAERTRGLESNASYTQSRTVTLSTKLSGTYFVTVQTDANNNVYEHTGEGNNLTHSSPRAISAYPPSDLAVSDLARPDSALSGSTIAVSWKVTNIGPATTLTQGWSDQLYFSTDTQLDPSRDLLMATVARSGALRSQENYTRQFNLTLANGFFGDYYLIVVSDAGGAVNDADRSNNVNVAVKRMHIGLAPSPDLTITSLRLPSQVNAGQPLLLTFTVANRGNGGLSNRTWFDAVYLSQNATLDNADQTLATKQRSVTLPPNSSYTDSVEVEMPGQASGTYFLIMKTDSRNDIYEHNAELNNVRVGSTTSSGVDPIDIKQPAPADLIVSSITIPTNAFPGEEVAIAWTLKNIGKNRATGRLRDAVYISADTIFQAEDPVFGVLTYHIDLPPGGTQQMSMQVNLAQLFRADAKGNLIEELPGLTPGQYHALVRTDIRRNIRESNTENNTLASVEVMNTDVPELRLGVPVTGMLAGGEKRYYKLKSVAAGATIQIDLQSSDGTTANELYVAFDRTPTVNDFDLAAIEPQEANQRVTIPSSQIGEYFILLNSRSRIGLNAGFTLRADSLTFAIHSVETNVGGNTGQVTVKITGAKFDTLMSVFLLNANDTLFAVHTAFVDPTRVYSTFDLNGVAPAFFDVHIINEDSSKFVLPGGFEVVTGSPPNLKIDFHYPAAARLGSTVLIEVIYENIGNIDISQELILKSINGSPLAFSQEALANRHMELSIPILEKSGFPGFLLRPGANGRTIVHAKAQTSDSARGFSSALSNPIAAVLVWGYRIYRGYQLAKIVLEKSIDCEDHLKRNQYNKEAKGNLIFIRPADGGRSYYRDENGAVWLLLTEDESKFHGTENVKLVRPDVSRPGASFETVRRLAPGEKRDSPIFTGENVRTGEFQQTYNFRDHLIGGFVGHGLRDVLPHCKCNYDDFNPIWCALGHTHGNYVKDYAVYVPKYDTCNYYDKLIDLFGPCNNGNVPPNDEEFSFPIQRALDPNDITGTAGFGDEHWITATQTLPYTIRFENDSTRATAAAQVVTITQKLDSTLDARSFRLGSFGFANHNFTVPENRAFYSERLDVRDSLGVFVDVTAGIDITTNEAFWIFRAIDPATGQLPVFRGFLPVNDAQHRGEGFANYTIRPKRNAKTGDVVRAKARIVFDTNEPIDTPEIFNTIDAVVPGSRVTALPPAFNKTTLSVNWSGMDDSNGSQIRDFTLYVSADGKPFELFEDGLTDTSLVFSGDFGSTYRFFTIVRDNAGNVEAFKTAAEASVTLDPTVAVAENKAVLPKTFALYQNYPNPFNPTTIIKYDLPVPSEVRLEIFDILGRRVRVLVDTKQNAGFHSALWDGKTAAGRSVATGVYFYRIEAKGFVKTRKMLLVR